VEGNAYKVAYGKAEELSKETGLPVTKWDIVIENGGVCVYDFEDDEKPKKAKEEKKEKEEEKPEKEFADDFGDVIDAILEGGIEVPKISFCVCDDICEEASDWAGLFSGK
jgi:predicted dehydrogenase